MKTTFFYTLRWLLISSIVGFLAGSLSAFFLATLSLVTQTREANAWLIWCLPIGGFAVGWMYDRFGRGVDAGHNLILDEIHTPSSPVPFRMIPLILLGTWLTHLFGGSAGREGTAVQMGASVADRLTMKLKLTPDERTTILMAGMSAGFGSVFGVPLAGTIFGIEVLAIGHLRYRRVLECLMASLVGHFTVLAWGVHHTLYAAPQIPAASAPLVISVLVAGVVFGLGAQVFSRFMHLSGEAFKKAIASRSLRAAVGGLVVLVGYRLIGSDRYAGLGLPVIQDSLQTLVPAKDFALKTLFTVLTLSSGMKGGEVTPLLFIGSTFGNALSALLPVHFSLLAALGLVAVFAGAANTPLACTLMAMELFGPQIGWLALLACYASFYASGHRGIYRAQKVARSKYRWLKQAF